MTDRDEAPPDADSLPAPEEPPVLAMVPVKEDPPPDPLAALGTDEEPADAAVPAELADEGGHEEPTGEAADLPAVPPPASEPSYWYGPSIPLVLPQPIAPPDDPEPEAPSPDELHRRFERERGMLRRRGFFYIEEAPIRDGHRWSVSFPSEGLSVIWKLPSRFPFAPPITTVEDRGTRWIWSPGHPDWWTPDRLLCDILDDVLSERAARVE